MQNYVFGVDIGGTTVKLGLFAADGTLLAKWEIPTHMTHGGVHILPEIAQSIISAMELHGIWSDQVIGIGIGVPGPVDNNFTVNKCVNLGWGVFNIKERMNELLPDIPNVAAGNDANVAALGELWQGGGQGNQSAVMITLGTGVGGGVVLDRKIVAGRNGGAGEIGHMTVEPSETIPCSCGKCGCLEQYASAKGIVRMAKVMLSECDTPSKLRGIEDFTSKHICELADAGDHMALKIIDRFGDYLGRAMSYISCTIDPDIFIIGGGMSKSGDLVTNAALKYFQKYAFHVSKETGVVIATLGNDAGIYGCAKMVLA